VSLQRDRKVVDFKQVKGKLGKFSDDIIQRLSADQMYLYKICDSVMNKTAPPTTFFGNYHHARWLTLANRALWLYVTTEKPNSKLKKLVSFILNVYAPLWFSVKTKKVVSEGSKLFFLALQLVKNCDGLNAKDIDTCKKTLNTNSYYAHPEWILLAMLCDDSPDIRAMAISKIKDLREQEQHNPSEEIRVFVKPTLQWSASKFYDLIDWKETDFYEPPLTMDLSLDALESISHTPLVLPQFPCHNQAVERHVKDMTETSQRVAGKERRDAMMRNKIESRSMSKSHERKEDFFK
jgi:hypothetical protein